MHIPSGPSARFKSGAAVPNSTAGHVWPQDWEGALHSAFPPLLFNTSCPDLRAGLIVCVTATASEFLYTQPEFEPCVCVCVCVCVCTCISVCMLPPFCVGLYRVIPNSRCILKICTHPCLFWLNIWVFQSPQNTMPHLLGDPSSVASASPSPLLPQRATYRVRGDPKGPRMLEIHTDGLHTMQTCCM